MNTETYLLIRGRKARALCRLIVDTAGAAPGMCFCTEFEAALDQVAAETWTSAAIRAFSKASANISPGNEWPEPSPGVQAALRVLGDYYRQEASAIYEARQHQAQDDDELEP